MEVVMENLRKPVLRKLVLRKCFLTLMTAAVILMLPVQDSFAAEAPSDSASWFSLNKSRIVLAVVATGAAGYAFYRLINPKGQVWQKEESDAALGRRTLIVLFALNSLGSKSCKDVNYRCLEFHLQPVCMPDGTIYRNPQGQLLFLTFNVENLSAALGQRVRLPANADQDLYKASMEGQTGLIVFFLAVGVDVGVVNQYGSTPLYCAALFGHMQVCDLLIVAGANAGAANKDGYTPLHGAAMGGYEQVCDLLIAAGANAGAADNNGMTPLYCAVVNRHEQVCNLLLAAGANVDAADNNGNTPLHYAVVNRHEQVCNLLLAAGADPRAADQDGQTPAMTARAENHLNLARILEAAEAAASVVPGSVGDVD
jgi:ankyrin repeat protein